MTKHENGDEEQEKKSFRRLEDELSDHKVVRNPSTTLLRGVQARERTEWTLQEREEWVAVRDWGAEGTGD